MALNSDWLGSLKGKATEAARIAEQDRAQRKAAGERARSVILTPKDVSGSYDAARVLTTTLGGESRVMTHQDLIAFRKNIEATKARFKKGVTARQVIDLASTRPMHHKDGGSDITRAKKQIKHAPNWSFNSGVMRFLPNASGENKERHYHVNVEFLSYGAAAAAGTKTPRDWARWLTKQPIKFECTCKRHQYWFRYLATIGGYNFGRAESGYPKIRNPSGKGIACKHALRVMSEIDSGAFPVIQMLTKAITAAWAKTDGSSRVNLRSKQAEIDKQVKGKGKEVIKTTADRKAEAQAAKERKAARNALKEVKTPPKLTPAQKKLDYALKTGQLTQEQIEGARRLGITDDLIARMVKK